LAADLGHPPDLLHRQLVLRGQPHHQPPPPTPRFLWLGLGGFDFHHQLPPNSGSFFAMPFLAAIAVKN
jgi:hypothetical protein